MRQYWLKIQSVNVQTAHNIFARLSVAQLSFEVDQHSAVHILRRITQSHNLKSRVTHITHTIHTTMTTTCFMLHNLVLQSGITKFLSVRIHLYSNLSIYARTLQNINPDLHMHKFSENSREHWA